MVRRWARASASVSPAASCAVAESRSSGSFARAPIWISASADVIRPRRSAARSTLAISRCHRFGTAAPSAATRSSNAAVWSVVSSRKHHEPATELSRTSADNPSAVPHRAVRANPARQACCGMRSHEFLPPRLPCWWSLEPASPRACRGGKLRSPRLARHGQAERKNGFWLPAYRSPDLTINYGQNCQVITAATRLSTPRASSSPAAAHRWSAPRAGSGSSWPAAAVRWRRTSRRGSVPSVAGPQA